uniref:Uncharacterized protein n=1 Tax=Sphaeramia orbicularis TaxID=375764 RepID=A0A673BEL3_9TELE
MVCYKDYIDIVFVLSSVVRIHAAKQAHPTNTDITLLALTDVSDLWSSSGTWRLQLLIKPTGQMSSCRYNVTVVMSSGGMSFTSEVFPLNVQRVVKLNRLVHRASVLQNHTFGDGSSKSGLSTEQHVFHRTGEFIMEVKVSNLVSSASLTSHIFVVDRPCQPPPVKNMGPFKIQVRRYEVIRLGVTYETEVDCDAPGGLYYSWTLYDSVGRVFPLLLIDTHRQSLILPSHHLHYDTYTATARVQVVGSIVYSNYSVRVQVMPSPPIAIIDGGTNIFINNRNTTIVTLDGRRSYDPDFPLNPVSLTWTCKPVSSIISSCFDQLVPASSPVLTFPASFLKHNFDQFRFTLTIHSGERSASSETFLTIKSNLKGKVSVYCPLCRGDQVNWDQSFSISASCEDCDISPKLIQFSWSLFLVNASSKPVIEIPFCYTVDLNAPSAIMDNLATSPPIPETSTLNPPNTDATQYSSPPSSPKMTQNLLKKGNEQEENIKRRPVTSLPYLYSGYSDSSLFSDASGYDDIVSEPSVESDSSAGWEFPVLESVYVFLLQIQCSSYSINCVFPGVDGETFIPIDGSEFDPLLHRDEGSNLVDSQPPVMIQEPTLLDLPRDSVDRGIFESYTSSGISSALLSFRPFSLKPGSRYMLEVTAKSQNSFLGRTQLFLKTEPVPRGMTCQVQPMNGLELHTHFSIFCTSGREDLLYKYSFSVGDRPPRTLYEGRDFQYYFNLPSGDPSDDYKVTVFTEIRSNTDGGVTKPCPVTVRVRPRFHREASSSHNDPDLELSEFSLKNLSALVGLGNTMETVNYISLLSSILNRLSLDSHEHKHIRNVLICTVCELQHTEQVYTNIISNHKINQNHFLHAPVRFHLDQKTLNTLVDLLSYSLQTFTSVQICNNTDIKEALEIDGCLADVSRGSHIKQGGFISSKQLVQLVADILHTASNLMLVRENTLVNTELRLDTGLICLYVTYLNQTSTVSSGSANVFIPASLIQRPFVHHVDSQSVRNHEKPCVLILLTELTHSPYTWASPGKLTGPVVELSFYKCSTRRKIPIRSIHQPINIDLQQMSSVYDSILQRSQINYHSFNITQEHLQQVIQLRVQFKPSFKKMFPIMLLFRMFERPTPSMHHLRRIHNWESNITHITLPSSYLSTSGVGHLAVLNADFAKRRRWKHLSDPVMYRVRVDSSLCVSWDDHQGAWTPHGCRTQQADTPTAAKCSCVQLRPLTVVKQQIQCSRDTTDVNPFISVSSNLTVPIVLVLCVSLYILGLVLIRTTGVESGERRVHYLSDNLPCDPHLYAVTVHTGLCSAAKMSAKVYIVLYGEDGFSQTKELQVPGCTLFRRNSQDTFIISAAENLGSVYRVHIWHDNSGPSPVWYIKQVEVHEVNRGRVEGRPWLFIGQCWLAVNKSDGRVDRMLRVCTQGTGFSKMLYLKLSEYMADFHPWISVCSCPHPHSFTHTHRLTMCLLLLLGYSCVNTVIISQTDEQLPLELGIADLSAVSVTTGILSVIAVLPAATVISLLFRLHKVKLVGSEVKDAGNRKTDNDTELTSVSTWQLDKKDDEKPVIQTDVTISNVDSVVADSSKGAAFNSGLTSQWCHCVAWVLCLLLCLSSLVLSTLLAARQRARYLRLVRPPTSRELRKTLYKRHQWVNQSLCFLYRNLSFYASMLLLMLCITFGSSFSDHYHLNNAIRNQFTRRHDNDFMSIKKYNDWWTWAQNNLLDLLYKNESSYILIGEPILLKTDTPNLFHGQVTNTQFYYCINILTSAASNLKLLLSCGWLTTQTVELKVHFTLYSPAPSLFTSVTLITEQSPTGVLLPTANVHSVRIYHIPAVWDYIVMICQSTRSSLWLHFPALLLYFSLRNYKEHVDVSLLAMQQQYIRTLRGIIVFLLILKCVSVLKVNKTLTTSTTLLTPTLSTLLWTTVNSYSNTKHYCSIVFFYCLQCIISHVLLVKKLLFIFQTYHMEEFESLVDELLCRLNTLSDSLHHTLPSKSHRYREDHPAISSVQESSKMDTQVHQSAVITDVYKQEEKEECENQIISTLWTTVYLNGYRISENTTYPITLC